jgi:hypothetical protein
LDRRMVNKAIVQLRLYCRARHSPIEALGFATEFISESRQNKGMLIPLRWDGMTARHYILN